MDCSLENGKKTRVQLQEKKEKFYYSLTLWLEKGETHSFCEISGCEWFKVFTFFLESQVCL